VAAFLIAAPALAGDWPQWLGPDRNGVSAETGLLTAWPEAGPEVLWRARLGKGFSGIAVAADRLYTMYADEGNEYVVCLDADDGEQLWRVKTGGYYQEKQGGDGPRSTPLVDGEIVYVLSAEGTLHALAADTGGKIWQKSLVEEFASKVPRWGFSTSPLVEGDLLFVEVGGIKGNILVNMVVKRAAGTTVAAIDKKTGRTVWTSLKDKMSYSSPIAYMVNGARQVAFFTAYALVGLSPKDGRLLWRFPWKTRYDVSAATPVFVAPDRIFISSGGNGAVVRIKEDGVEEVWKNREMKNHFGTSVHLDGYLYGFDESILKCIDVQTGEEKWKTRGYAKGTLIAADGHLIVLGEQGNLGLVEATPERFDERAGAQVMNARCWTVPSLAEGILYLRDETEIVAVDLRQSVE
jgi:outer membrane protein assembly factor BamB